MVHEYSVILTEADPQFPQPEKITISLKPHQKAGLEKARAMEQDEHIYYNVPDPRYHISYMTNQNPNIYGAFKLKTNVGVIGDIVGYGKTLIALSMVAALPLDRIHVPDIKNYCYHNDYGYLEIIKNNSQKPKLEHVVNTTLAVVPRGPVYMQWKHSLATHTTLKYIAIDNLSHIRRLPQTVAELKTYLGTFDIVLIKNTTLQVFLNYYRNIDHNASLVGFARIMIDEAHTITMRIPEMYYKYLWLITSSYRELFSFNYTKSIYSSFLQVTQHSLERLHYILIKGDTNFVKNSFSVPPPVEHYYMCKHSRTLSAIQAFLTASVQERINVNDISGAVRELGGLSDTEDGIVEAILSGMNKDISNKEKEIHFLSTLEIDEESRQHRIQTQENELRRLVNKRDALLERITEINTKTCPVCMDTIQDPVYLSCSHIFCGACLLKWMQQNLHTRSTVVACPECRTPIDSNKIVAIVKEKQTSDTIPILVTKEETLLSIINSKPTGRFLLFSRMDVSLGHLSRLLMENGIRHCEIKGNTHHMMNMLEEFKNHKLRVILLNTVHAGFGIDISCATDVIIYHSMPQEKIQAVGRAQRVGRTEALHIHNLCYPHEAR
jgi:SNF2 family DNA or RNA helicase